MSKVYAVTVTRTLTETATILVETDDANEALHEAEQQVMLLDFKPSAYHVAATQVVRRKYAENSKG